MDIGRAQWEIAGLLIAAAVVTWLVIRLAYKEIRYGRRRRALARALAECQPPLRVDWPAMLAVRPQLRNAVQGDGAALARVRAVQSPEPRVALVDGEADAHISRVMAYRGELAAHAYRSRHGIEE